MNEEEAQMPPTKKQKPNVDEMKTLLKQSVNDLTGAMHILSNKYAKEAVSFAKQQQTKLSTTSNLEHCKAISKTAVAFKHLAIASKKRKSIDDEKQESSRLLNELKENTVNSKRTTIVHATRDPKHKHTTNIVYPFHNRTANQLPLSWDASQIRVISLGVYGSDQKRSLKLKATDSWERFYSIFYDELSTATDLVLWTSVFPITEYSFLSFMKLVFMSDCSLHVWYSPVRAGYGFVSHGLQRVQYAGPRVSIPPVGPTESLATLIYYISKRNNRLVYTVSFKTSKLWVLQYWNGRVTCEESLADSHTRRSVDVSTLDLDNKVRVCHSSYDNERLCRVGNHIYVFPSHTTHPPPIPKKSSF